MMLYFEFGVARLQRKEYDRVIIHIFNIMYFPTKTGRLSGDNRFIAVISSAS